MNAINNSHTKLPPIHPGEILNEEFLKPMGVSQYRLSKSIGVDSTRIRSIVRGERSITAETALLFSRYFGNSVEFGWGCRPSTIANAPKTRCPNAWPLSYLGVQRPLLDQPGKSKSVFGVSVQSSFDRPS